mmetsp:Transcript_26434/g.70656  ORF Transcript_26434/g.70656 Transcript_26434/m.70656 type:complete len:275 (+) Transcript_26434:3322-4146(+)
MSWRAAKEGRRVYDAARRDARGTLRGARRPPLAARGQVLARRPELRVRLAGPEGLPLRQQAKHPPRQVRQAQLLCHFARLQRRWGVRAVGRWRLRAPIPLRDRWPVLQAAVAAQERALVQLELHLRLAGAGHLADHQRRARHQRPASARPHLVPPLVQPGPGGGRLPGWAGAGLPLPVRHQGRAEHPAHRPHGRYARRPLHVRRHPPGDHRQGGPRDLRVEDYPLERGGKRRELFCIRMGAGCGRSEECPCACARAFPPQPPNGALGQCPWMAA